MTTPNDGGPAFPTENEHQTGSATYHYAGMSLRDYFAGQALSGWLASYGTECEHPSFTGNALATVEASYKMADAMLAERTKGLWKEDKP